MNDAPESARQSSVSHRRLVLSAAVALLLGLAIAGFLLLRPSADPLPYVVTGAVGYRVYFPKPLAAGFGYEPGSARLEQSQIIVYALVSGAKRVTVTEQAMPASPPDLSHLNGFTTGQTPIGNAAYGTAGHSPSAIILSPTTLITLIGQGGATTGDVQAVAGRLQIVEAD